MFRRCLAILVVLSLALVILVTSASTQNNEEEQGRAAEQAGKLREAMSHYLTALKSSSEGGDARLRLTEKVIKISTKLDQPPPVPDEAIRQEGRAEAAMSHAKTRAEFMEAVNEYKKAIQFAPWVARYYFFLAEALEGAGERAEAIRNLKLALLGAPTAEDRVAIQKKIAGLEYLLEKDAKSRADEIDRWNVKDKIAGEWIEGRAVSIVSFLEIFIELLSVETRLNCGQ
jgi:tetratricopeptide (TPR) repeat protein